VPRWAARAAHRHASAGGGVLSRVQLTAPVRWRQTCEAIPALGIDRVVELGPGGVLAGLAKRCLPGTPVLSVSTPDDLEALR
jgi:[acyl-carrier-protein] S-malonyltransferase